MIRAQEHWQKILEDLGLLDIPLKRVFLSEDYSERSKIDVVERHKTFKKFLKHVVDNALSDLVKANFKKNEIMDMRVGICPENISVNLKNPVEYGGNYSFDNMYITKKTPFSDLIEEFHINQVQDFKLREGDEKMPEIFYAIFPVGFVFIPTLSQNFSGGSNKESNLDQIASVIELSSREV